jgi:acetoin utilization deacetylase AcuC-like enzyme
VLFVAGPVGEDSHDGGRHPERPARVTAAMAGVGDLGLGDEVVGVEIVLPSDDQLALVHEPRYLRELAAFSAAGGGQHDADTYVTHDSWEAARRSVGAGLGALQALEAAGDGVAFVAARPPGHHALPGRGMGFCLLNNIAVAAATLTAQGERVLIVDWDVHHGNGTQAIFWDDPSVFYVSVHQWPLYPGSGRADEVGGPDAPGLTLNIPLPAGATGDVVHRALTDLAVPAIEHFSPTWVLVSAGFDAHRADPIAELALSSGDFAELARLVGDLVPRPGRLALFLEGGYDLHALRASVRASLGALLGEVSASEPATSGGPGRSDIEDIGRVFRQAVDHVHGAAGDL